MEKEELQQNEVVLIEDALKLWSQEKKGNEERIEKLIRKLYRILTNKLKI